MRQRFEASIGSKVATARQGMKMRVAVTAALLLAGFGGSQASAGEATTFAESFAVPVFNRIDGNGVDLVSGVWRVRTPTMWIGDGEYRQERGLEWTGRAWAHIGQPSLWRDGEKYIVMYDGASYEFNDRDSNFSKRKPIDGTKLECQFELPADIINKCYFTSREGDKVWFRGFHSSLSNYGQYFGYSALEFGNVGITQAIVSRTGLGGGEFTGCWEPWNYCGGGTSIHGSWVPAYGQAIWDHLYNKPNYSIWFGDQRLRISTPSNNDENDDHYLRPKSTIQTVTDDFGSVWTYQFNADRELTRVTQPGGAGAISATYNSDHKVATITTPAGTWTYTYTEPGDLGTTTVTSPDGEVTYVKYHREYGYVTEARDPLQRPTYYFWNADRRLEKVTYPEGNHVVFLYDARGNIRHKTEFAKDGVTKIVMQAGYAASCTAANAANCNQPLYIIDGEGNRTDFEYANNSPKPTKIIQPAAAAGQPRPTVINQYVNGQLARSASCMTLPTCAGTADEVVTELAYIARVYRNTITTGSFIEGHVRVPYQKTVSWNGEVRRTCLQYDTKGHLIGMTPPGALRSACPTATVDAVAVNANPPISTGTRLVPVFPDGSSGSGDGGGGDGGGGDGGGWTDPCGNLPPGMHCP